MRLRFVISGSEVFSMESDCVPPVGSRVVITTKGYKSGVFDGSIIEFLVRAESPPVYDFADGKLEVSVDVENWTVLKKGTPPDDEDED